MVLMRLLVIAAFIYLLWFFLRARLTALPPERRCPACGHTFRAPGSRFDCPRCRTKLGSRNDGTLYIRVN